MFTNEVQSLKVCIEILVKLLGRVTLTSEVQFSNTLLHGLI